VGLRESSAETAIPTPPQRGSSFTRVRAPEAGSGIEGTGLGPIRAQDVLWNALHRHLGLDDFAGLRVHR